MNTVADAAELAYRLRTGLDRVILGQGPAKEGVLACLLAGGHALLEGPPGTAKTLLALALSRLIGGTFRRIQFTPDLMPVDVVGTNVFSQKTSDFAFIPGPVFSDVLLADEINRTPPRTQAALLEAMQERAVTIDGVRRALGETFFVLATQNPMEYEGTYPLPEAQKDRFLMKIAVSWPAADDELAVLQAYAAGNALHRIEVEPVVDLAALAGAQRIVATQVRIEEKLLTYIRDVVTATRHDESISLGAGPRAGLALLSAGRALAVLRGRDFVTPDDIKELAWPVLIHRIVLAPEAEMEGTDLKVILERIFARTEVPR